MDDHERDKFYSAEAADEDEGEYELEPPDPEILVNEERRAAETVDATRTAVDIEEIYRDVEHQRSSEILEAWLRDFRLRFQVKHLLVATAVLAILLTLIKLGFGMAIVIGVILAVAALSLYLHWQDKKQQAEANLRRQEMYVRRRATLDPSSSSDASLSSTQTPAGPAPSATPLRNEKNLQIERAGERFQIHFSLMQLMATITGAALLLGLIQLLGGPSNAATLLGLFALFGLLVHALGFEPPETVVLGWWLMLVMYVLLSIVGVFLGIG